MSINWWTRVLRIVAALSAFLVTGIVVAQVCAVPGIDGNVTTGGITNTYYRPANGTYTAGATIALNNAAGISPIGATNTLAADQLVAIFQMQCADINSTDTDSYGDGVAGGVDASGGGSVTTGRGYAGGYTQPAASCLPGQYEYFRTGVGTSATQVVVPAGSITGTYVQAAATATAGKRTFQIIRMPQYANLTVNATLTAPAWNGFTGGVVMVDVAQNLAWAGFGVNVQGLGFRGGVWAPAALQGTTPVGGVDDRSSATNGATFGTAGTAPVLPSVRGSVFPFRAPRDAATPASGGYTTTTSQNVVRGGGKGEGIAGTPSNLTNGDGYPFDGVSTTIKGDRSSGAPGNAGGGGSTIQDCCRDNGGGGGGGNGGIGGRGGTGWATNQAATGTPPNDTNRPNWSVGEIYGYGGAAFAQASATRVVMGGGGGAGQSNDTIGSSTTAPRGGVGGGIVIIRATSYSGGTAGTIINVRGENAPDFAANDAAGGGGAAGSIVLIAYNAGGGVGTVTYEAIGGDGGDSSSGDQAHGPGGGGGGGVIFTTGTTPLASATAGGVAGVTQIPTIDGATDGRHGSRSASGFSGSLGGISPPSNICLPSVTKTYNPRTIPVGGSSTLTVVLTNPANVNATLQQALTDPVNAPVSITTASTTTAAVATAGTGTGTCANTGIVVTGSGSLGFPNGYIIPANRTCTVTVQVTSSTAGGFVNTIPAGTAAGGLRTRLGASTVDLNAPSTADTLAVIDPTKSVVLQADTAPTGVSVGDTLRYTITYSLPAGATTISNFQIWDILPAQVTKVGAAGTNVTVTPTGAGTAASVNSSYTGVAGATTSSLLATGATLAAGGSIVVTIDATINTGTAPGVNIDNTARAEGSGLPAVTGNGAAGGIPSDARNTAAANNITQATNSTLGDPTRVVIPFAPTLSKTSNPQYIAPGQTSVFTLSLGNSNTSALTLTQNLVDNLPTNVVLATPLAVSTTCGGTGLSPAPVAGGTSVTLATGSTIPNGGCTVTLSVTSSTAGAYTNTIPAGTAANGLNTNGGAAPTASAPLVVLEPAKSVRLLTDADTSGAPSVGDTVQYQIVYTLPGDAPAIPAFQIFDVLPSQVTYVASSLVVTPSGGTPAQTATSAGAAYLGTAASATSAALLNPTTTLQPGGTITATINATINATAVNGTAFNNTARGTGTGLPAITGNGAGGGLPSDADATPFGTPASALPQPNDTAATGEPTQVTPAAPNADLVITKSQPSATVNPGGTITYTVTVTNNGPATANNVVVTDTLPVGTTFVSVTGGGVIGTPTPSGGVLTLNGTNTSTLGSLANGVSQVFTITVTAP
jgi:uncharacterized repeat protein (TIGR01451 family)/fimbrial isopeptide formation D2 family protein